MIFHNQLTLVSLLIIVGLLIMESPITKAENLVFFSSYKLCGGNFKIKVVDGSLSVVPGKGYIILSSLITIQDVLHVLNLTCNLLSVDKLTQNKNTQAHFFDTHCVLQELISGKMIGTVRKMVDSTSLKMDQKTNINLDQ